jgi:hypothetical protein
VAGSGGNPLASVHRRRSARATARKERSAERDQQRHRVIADLDAAYMVAHDGAKPPEPIPSREIKGWSQQSRANMVRALAELDYAPMFTDPSKLPAMVTLTYPGDWLTVAPNGKAVKKHFIRWRKRYFRAWGVEIVCVWKLEFQRRGAPHLHLWTVPPHGLTKDGQNFRAWLSTSWAAVVAHPDPEEYRNHLAAGTGVDYAEGLRASDPRRLAVYFSKHGGYSAKEYQNIVPEPWQEPGQGPGRFWGYYGLKRRTAVVDVTPADAVEVARIVRRWSKSQRVTRQVEVWRSRGGFARPAYPEVLGVAGLAYLEPSKARKRKVRRRVVRMKRGRGFIVANDGPSLAADVARAISVLRD